MKKRKKASAPNPWAILAAAFAVIVAISFWAFIPKEEKAATELQAAQEEQAAQEQQKPQEQPDPLFARLQIEISAPDDLLNHNRLTFIFSGPLAPDEKARAYDIPEEYVKALNEVVKEQQQHTIEVDAYGATADIKSLGMLYIDNAPWTDYLRDHPLPNQPKPAE